MAKIKMIFVAVLFCALDFFSCSAQPYSPFAPEAGNYTGSITGVAAGYQYGYNAATGFGIQNTTQIQVTKSPFGNLVITNTGNNKGKYVFPSVKDWAGTWQYDEANDKLNFTGILKDAINYYHAGKGFYTLQLDLEKDKTNSQRVIYSYTKKASKAFPKQTNANGNLSGSFTIKPDGASIAFLDAKTAGIKESFTGKLAATNANHTTLAVGFSDDAHYYQITVFDAKGNATVYNPEKIKSWNWDFHSYQFGILAIDNTTVALLGKMSDKLADFKYSPGEYVIAAGNIKTGQLLGTLPIEYNRYVKPAFLPDGRLLYSPKEGGIAVSDAKYNSSKIIYSNPVNALAASPDGKKIAVSEGLFLYTINTDGTEKKQLLCNGEPFEADKAENMSDICWSPDGKYIAISYGSSAYNIVIVPLDGSKYRFIKDEYGEVLQQKNPLMSWH